MMHIPISVEKCLHIARLHALSVVPYRTVSHRIASYCYRLSAGCVRCGLFETGNALFGLSGEVGFLSGFEADWPVFKCDSRRALCLAIGICAQEDDEKQEHAMKC